MGAPLPPLHSCHLSRGARSSLVGWPRSSLDAHHWMLIMSTSMDAHHEYIIGCSSWVHHWMLIMGTSLDAHHEYIIGCHTGRAALDRRCRKPHARACRLARPISQCLHDRRETPRRMRRPGRPIVNGGGGGIQKNVMALSGHPQQGTKGWGECSGGTKRSAAKPPLARHTHVHMHMHVHMRMRMRVRP